MSDVALASMGCKRRGNALGADSIIAATVRGEQDVVHGRVDRRLARNQPAVDRAQEVGVVKNGSTRGIGMDNAAFRIEQDHAGTQPIQNVSETGRFGFLDVDGFADKQRAANMRYDQRHASAHFVVNHAAGVVPDNAEQRAACSRPLDYGACNVDPTLRMRPFAIETAAAKPVVRNEIGSAHHLWGIRRILLQHRLEFRIVFGIGLQALGLRSQITVQAF